MRSAEISLQNDIASGSLLEQVGATPLIRLGGPEKELDRSGVELYAKAEWFNPGGSVKDRAASKAAALQMKVRSQYAHHSKKNTR